MPLTVLSEGHQDVRHVDLPASRIISAWEPVLLAGGRGLACDVGRSIWLELEQQLEHKPGNTRER